MSEQHDDHIWLTVRGEAWAIRRIRGRTFHLWRGYEPNLEFCAVDILDPDWDAYCAAAVELLRKQYPTDP
ncbi:hypothetical protein QA640_14800 [Bradyrhizobium sp. CB82]|uniref:hypothetical protein n=1 Tax=Bradyrhizobium sp. CB82 TaxID=3039159 RepID=UPI0024B175EC|nr:hypothetical protein [Bradyrhizobium sp. CB82]WFU43592.1 hypothetical protein QA640_14800 [Bradyrhizobium sp. CB82]